MGSEFMTELNDGTIVCNDHGEIEEDTATDYVRSKHPQEFINVFETVLDDEPELKNGNI